MSTQPADSDTAQSAHLQGVALPRRYRFDVDEYYAMAGVGIFDEDDRVELLDGQIIEMTPVSPRHAYCVMCLNRAFHRRCADGAIVSVHNPIRLSRYSEPMPDVALIKLPFERYDDAHPGPDDVLLLVEVADTSLAYDRRKTRTHYATSGIAEVWLVKPEAREIEVYRTPSASGYADVRQVREGALNPVAFPDVAIGIEEILGPPPGALHDEILARRYRFDVDEYNAMARAGIFHEDDRVELIDGQIIEMTPVGRRHTQCVDRLTWVLSSRWPNRAVVTAQHPIRVARSSEPQPDISLLAPPRERYDDAHPGPDDVLLIVEVADGSLAYDRDKKLPLYARASIPEVWIVNLEAREIEVYRKPSAFGYAESHRVHEGTVSCQAFPDDAIDLEEIFGPPK